MTEEPFTTAIRRMSLRVTRTDRNARLWCDSATAETCLVSQGCLAVSQNNLLPDMECDSSIRFLEIPG